MDHCHAPLLLAVLLSACHATGSRTERAANAHPNVLVILTDDQGHGDLRSHGNPVLDTPRLDALAAESAAMERFYVSPVCTPTRAALMTGRNSVRTRAIDTYRGRAMMAPAEVTIAEVLRDAGYATGLFGKWHLGDNHPMRPQDQGFEKVLCHRGGGLAQPADHIDNRRRYTDAILFEDGVPVQTEGFCMDVYAQHAVRFMEESAAADRPFFAYVATNTPHGPFHDVPEELRAKYAGRDLSGVLDDPKQADRLARCLAMVENVDQNVGRLLDAIERLGLAEDTIVVYLHDNGPNMRRYVGEMRGMKSEVFEGGIRTPFFVRWPGVVPAGLRRAEIAAHVDLWPTLVEATGVDAPAVEDQDGRSIWPLLTDTAAEWPDRLLHIQAHRGDRRVAEHNFAVIGQRYKLLRASGFGRETPPADSAFALFDLENDPREEADLFSAEPEIAASLLRAHREWFADAIDHEGFGTPPPIVVDFDVEPSHELNRNDWRPIGGGYGAAGEWHLSSASDRRLTVRVRTRGGPKAPGTARVEVMIDGEVQAASDVVIDDRRARLDHEMEEAVLLPRGAHRLGVRVTIGDAPWAAEHVILAPAR